MTVTNPRVSVLLPVRDGAGLLATSLDSVFAQTFEDFELVVVDDGSVDDTPRLLDAVTDDRLVRVRLDESRGISGALNAGLSVARAPLVARLDHDDIARPDRLRRQVEVFTREPATGLVVSASDIIDAAGQRIATRHLPSDQAGLMLVLLFANCITHSSVMFRRDVVTAAGGYHAEWTPAEDYDLWLRLMWEARIAVIGDPLVAYRIWDGSVSSRQRDKMVSTARRLALRAVSEAVGDEVDTDVVAGLAGDAALPTQAFDTTLGVLVPAIRGVRTACRTLGVPDAGLAASAARLLRRSRVLGEPRSPSVRNLLALSARQPAVAAHVAAQSWSASRRRSTSQEDR